MVPSAFVAVSRVTSLPVSICGIGEQPFLDHLAGHLLVDHRDVDVGLAVPAACCAASFS